MRENNAYPPLFWGKWPKHHIDKQKLYNLPFATIYISHIFADISAIIEISETHKFLDSWFCDEFWERKDKEFLQNHKGL